MVNQVIQLVMSTYRQIQSFEVTNVLIAVARIFGRINWILVN